MCSHPQYLTKIKEIEDLMDSEEWQTYSKEKKEQV